MNHLIQACGKEVQGANAAMSQWGEGCGVIRTVPAKTYLRVFVETLVQDLPDTSVAKKEFLAVLQHFSDLVYATFAKTFGTMNGGASMPAAADVDIDNVKVEPNTEKADGGSSNEEVDDAYMKVKERTPGIDRADSQALSGVKFIYRKPPQFTLALCCKPHMQNKKAKNQKTKMRNAKLMTSPVGGTSEAYTCNDNCYNTEQQ